MPLKQSNLTGQSLTLHRLMLNIALPIAQYNEMYSYGKYVFYLVL